MTGAFAWIGRLAEWIGQWIPQVKHLECTDIAVTITRGSVVRVRSPGLVVLWPFWTSYYCRPGNIQTCIPPTKTLTTADGRTVVAGVMVRYEFDRSEESVVRALIETDSVEDSLADEVCAVLCALITSKTFSELMEDRTAINRSLTGRISTQLSQYGVRVLRAQLADLGQCINLNHTGGRPGVNYEEDEE